MQLRPDIQLQSAIKSMCDTVLPAIDANNQLALEQAQLVVATLQLVRQRLPLGYRFDCDELARLLHVAEELSECARGGEATDDARDALADTARGGADVLSRARAEPDELNAAVRSLRSHVGAVVQAVYEEGDLNSGEAVRKLILQSSEEQLLRERTWVLPQGWEPDPEALPPIEELLTKPGEARP